ncbi:MAG TPA: RIP metalloprotease RseP [Aquifex aeolicus]|nr:RIP metalloprotease RseP [Aquificales bacterium]HIQ26012.1 RIP metalloprotease RseP [Aquifex aeolicus]
METFLAFLIFIGILVLVHEFGHFAMAKAFGVGVEVFSIGFGPPIVRKKLGETVYQIALLPLGGFVKLHGEEDSEESRKDPRSFYAKPPWQRILIAFGGPLFNFLFAVLAFWFVYLQPQPIPKYLLNPPKVEYVYPSSPAQKLGLKRGDLILEVNGEPTRNWLELEKLLRENAGKEVTLTVLRDGKKITLKVKLSYEILSKGLGILPLLPPKVGEVQEGSPAWQVGLKRGDLIVAVNGKKVETWWDLKRMVQSSEGKPLKLLIKRGETLKEITLIPKPVKLSNGKTAYIVGIKVETEYVYKKLSPLQALKKAAEQTLFLTILTLKVIKGLIVGEVSFNTLGGPLSIAGFAGEAAKLGLVAFVSAMASLSVQLGLFNLLPLPLLDGGLILLFLAEWVRGKPLPPKFKEWWIKVGVVIIITLMVFIFTQDIIRFITTGKLIPSP